MAGIGLKEKQRVEFADLERFFSDFSTFFSNQAFLFIIMCKKYSSFLSMSMHIPRPRLLISYALMI